MKLKKILAAALATTMVLGSVLTVSATVQEEPTPTPTYEQQHSLAANAKVTVGGTEVKTSVSGVYAAKSVQGAAITTDLSTVKSSLGLTGSQKPVVIIYDTDVKKSHLAMDSVNAAIEAMGGSYVTSLYIDLSAKENGKKIKLADGSVAMSTGLPKTADTSKTYSVVCVQPGGVTTILEDQDTNPKTVTFAVSAGIGTYAIVAQ
jgi:hypothetical protein